MWGPSRGRKNESESWYSSIRNDCEAKKVSMWDGVFFLTRLHPTSVYGLGVRTKSPILKKRREKKQMLKRQPHRFHQSAAKTDYTLTHTATCALIRTHNHKYNLRMPLHACLRWVCGWVLRAFVCYRARLSEHVRLTRDKCTGCAASLLLCELVISFHYLLSDWFGDLPASWSELEDMVKSRAEESYEEMFPVCQTEEAAEKGRVSRWQMKMKMKITSSLRFWKGGKTQGGKKISKSESKFEIYPIYDVHFSNSSKLTFKSFVYNNHNHYLNYIYRRIKIKKKRV